MEKCLAGEKASCLKCEKNFYKSIKGSYLCQPCAAGKGTPEEGFEKCVGMFYMFIIIFIIIAMS